MKKSMKAALLSALVFPGAGHIFLKRYISGIVLAGVTCVSLYMLIARALVRAQEIVEKINMGELQLDVAAIMEMVTRKPVGTEAQLLNMGSTVLIISWIIAIVDSYIVGRGQDKDHEAEG